MFNVMVHQALCTRPDSYIIADHHFTNLGTLISSDLSGLDRVNAANNLHIDPHQEVIAKADRIFSSSYAMTAYHRMADSSLKCNDAMQLDQTTRAHVISQSTECDAHSSAR